MKELYNVAENIKTIKDLELFFNCEYRNLKVENIQKLLYVEINGCFTIGELLFISKIINSNNENVD